MSCPICTAPVENESCETCGSLEGVDASGFAASRVFGYDWAAGSVAPWRDASNRSAEAQMHYQSMVLRAAVRKDLCARRQLADLRADHFCTFHLHFPKSAADLRQAFC